MWADHLPHFVYRCYDPAGALLYVGSTRDLRGRLAKHKNPTGRAANYPAAGLYDRMAFWLAESHPNKASALAAERAAIGHERPELNIQSNRRTA